MKKKLRCLCCSRATATIVSATFWHLLCMSLLLLSCDYYPHCASRRWRSKPWHVWCVLADVVLGRWRHAAAAIRVRHLGVGRAQPRRGRTGALRRHAASWSERKQCDLPRRPLRVLPPCHAGLVEDGLRHFDAKAELHGLASGVEHYACSAALSSPNHDMYLLRRRPRPCLAQAHVPEELASSAHPSPIA